MKTTSLLLVGSVAANLALVAALWWRLPASQPHSPSEPSVVKVARAGKDSRETALQAALLSGDSAALTAAGVPSEIVRALAVGRAFEKMSSRMLALHPLSADPKYWRRDPGLRSSALEKEQQMELNKARRDFEEEMRTALGEDLESLFDGRESRYAFLPPAQREQLHRIERDYEDLQSQAYMDQEGIQLPADQEKLRLLRLEKDRDIAAIFTPEQREQYELRVSGTADRVRGLYGDAIQNDEEYRKIFALQKAFDDQYNNPDTQPAGPPSPDAARSRREAEQKLQDDILAALNPDQVAALRRTNDQDYKILDSVARRLNLPATTPEIVLSSRENYAAQSLQINANAGLTAAERRTQLQALATTAQNELQATLGADGAQAYAQRSPWLGLLKNGNAFSTNPKDASPGSRVIGNAVFPVQAPRNPAAPASAAPPKN